MNADNDQYPANEFSRRGTVIYDRDIRPALRPEDKDQFVAIDIASGQYELDTDDFVATERLLDKVPDAQIWVARVGQDAAYRIGGPFCAGDLA